MGNSNTSLRQLAKQLGVSQPFLSQIRAGKRPMPSALRAKVEALGAYHLLITQADKQMPGLARNGYNRLSSGRSAAVARLVWDQEVVSSILTAPIPVNSPCWTVE